MVSPALLIIKEDRRAELTTARKYHRCCVCEEYILPKTKYYSIIVGGGLGAIKFPERGHIDCLPAYFEKVGRSREL